MYFVITSLVLLSSCAVFKGFKQDALIEEIAEEVIEANTGVEVDFTPSSKE
jgi:hypothetical protein